MRQLKKSRFIYKKKNITGRLGKGGGGKVYCGGCAKQNYQSTIKPGLAQLCGKKKENKRPDSILQMLNITEIHRWQQPIT